MEVQNMSINDIKPYDNNPRNNDGAVDAVANSIKEFGFQQPIVVDKDMVIIVGHTRYRAAKMLGLKEVPVAIASNLSYEQAKAYRLADNKTNELANWNKDLLDSELQELLDTNIDMENFGFEISIDDINDEDEKIQGDVPVTDSVGIYHDYVVLKFETEIDWLQAQTFFNLKKVKWDIPRAKTPHIGIGRVLDGSKIIKQLLEKGVRLDEENNV